jgi:hypothetical protein
VLNDAAWLLATSNDPIARSAADALAYARKAVTATKRQNGGYLDTLAAAHAEAGEFTAAAAAAKEAIALIKEERLKAECQSRLKLYEANIPYREKNP